MRTPRHNVAPALIAAGLLALAACGDEPAADVRSPSGAMPTDDSTATLDAGVPDEPSAPDPVATEVPAATGPEPAPGAPTTTEPGTTEAPPSTETPPATEAPVVVQPAVLGGRALSGAVEDASDIETNPLPDLVVDDVRRGTAVNLRNVFPADRPVLLWMWAPH